MVGKVTTGTSFSGLEQYLTGREERVAWTEPRNVMATAPREAAREMEAAAGMAGRVERPVYHVSVSFGEADRPTREQMSAAADRVLGELGLRDHQALLVAHQDKGHPHLHVMVNRVHPDTGRTADVAFDYRRNAGVLRDLEKEWGMTRVPGHHARADGEAAPNRADALATGEARRAARTGEAPFPEGVRQRMGADLGRALDESKSWGELRDALARHGYELKPTERGMAITDGERHAKASAVDERLSRPRLEERFGENMVATKRDVPPHPAEAPGPDVSAKPAAGPEVPKPAAQEVSTTYDRLFGPPALTRATLAQDGSEGVAQRVASAERHTAPAPAGASGRAADVAGVAVAAVRVVDGKGDERDVPFKVAEVAVRAGVALASSERPPEEKSTRPEPPSARPDAAANDPVVRRIVEDVRTYERVAGVEAKLGAAVQAHGELEGQLRAAGRQGQEAGRLSDGFDRALTEAYRDPAAARRGFETLATREGPEAAVRAMRQAPERFGPVVAEERSKWLGLAREVDQTKGYEAARGAANVGEQYLHARVAAGPSYERGREALDAKGSEIRSLRHELGTLTREHGRPADLLQRIGRDAGALTRPQEAALTRALTPEGSLVVSRAVGLAKQAVRGVER